MYVSIYEISLSIRYMQKLFSITYKYLRGNRFSCNSSNYSREFLQHIYCTSKKSVLNLLVLSNEVELIPKIKIADFKKFYLKLGKKCNDIRKNGNKKHNITVVFSMRRTGIAFPHC